MTKKTSKPTKFSPATTPVDTASKLVVDDYQDRPATPPVATPAPTVAPAKSKSTIQSPVKVVWAVCEEMKSAARKDVVAECMRRGVNVHTAKTQYQRHLAASRAVKV
jgi:hypothetical protein